MMQQALTIDKILNFNFFLLFFPLLIAGQQTHASVVGSLQPEVEALNKLLSNPGKDPQQALQQLLAQTVNLERLTEITFSDYCEDSLESYEEGLVDSAHQHLVGLCQQQLAEVYRKRLIADLTTNLRRAALDSLYIDGYHISGDEGYVEIAEQSSEEATRLRCYVHQVGKKWMIEDLAVDGKLVSETYREICSDILDKNYSLPVLTARLLRQDYIVLEDFSTTPPRQLPRDWGWHPKDEKKPKLYHVEIENGRSYLAAQDTGHTVILLKYSHWNPRKYPIMTWCWRANALPPGGNERLNHANDSAAGLYVIFSANWLGVFKQIKYVWSSTLPEGTVDRRKKIFRPWFFVVESGEKNLGKWTFEQADIYKAHKRVFGGSKPKKRTIGLGLLTDANNTNSYAEAFYADIRVWTREAQKKGLIVDHCTFCEETTDGMAGDDYGSLFSQSRENTLEGHKK